MAIDKTTALKQAVRRDEVYTLSQFLQRVGLSRSGLRACERRGLKTFRSGGRKFIAGSEWHKYLEEQEARKAGEQWT